MTPRNVLVTGGSNGIGRAVVRLFASKGDTVWFTYHSGRARADDLLAECRRSGWDRVAAFAFRQGDRDSHERLLAALPGPVDVLVNNAAVGSKTVERYEPDPARRDEAFFRINSVGPLWLIRQLVPGMVEREYGKVVNVSSVGGGISQFPGFHVADGMSKAALAYLTRHLAAELAHTPVDITAVCPGAVETPMFEASTLASLAPDERRAFAARLPKGRLIHPEEMAEVVWWLAGDGSRVLHGAVVDASMGLGVHPGLLTGRAAEGPDSRAADGPYGASTDGPYGGPGVGGPYGPDAARTEGPDADGPYGSGAAARGAAAGRGADPAGGL
ncbi:SDR family NAD(P)-dependent oxidoreductase [Streptomyces sp. B1866]|uniref:SDR family NAD(P)-dependent oxidoreductase n=1 Tax=Streptomyces sp. B1866 TaxID=3075431 RepID=UPI0028901A03|nr:SDR family NAD(P)-dependent oxidoreductase [Streptomyces sp. B1866]MDT3397227.1 SDR family NAD(P)-dependent oxidoreductase [Streptomyces sp. B1866]